MAIYGTGQRKLGSGITMPGIAGQAVLRGRVVYMSAADGLWYPADSDALATLPAVGVTMEQAISAGQVIQILLIGIIGRGDWTWIRGDILYSSGTGGVMTQVAPANAQPIGVALTASLIYVNPTLSVVGTGAGSGTGYDATALVTIPIGTDPPQILWNHAQATLVAGFHPQTEPTAFEWLEVVDINNIIIHMASVDLTGAHIYRVFAY